METVTPKPLQLTQTIDLEFVQADYLKSCIRMMLYGETGTGKTYLAVGADRVEGMGPIMYLDMDRGTTTFADRPEVKVVPVFSMEKMELVLKYLRVVDHPFKTIVMDCISAFVLTLLDERLAVPGRKGFDSYVPTLQDYLYVTMRIRRIVQALKRSNYHYICVANVRTEKDVSGMVETFPELVGRQARGIGREFDLVGYMYVNAKPDHTIERFLQTIPFAARAAKCRSPHPLPPIVRNPTMQGIYDHLIGSPSPVSDSGVSVPEPPGAPASLTLEHLQKET